MGAGADERGEALDGLEVVVEDVRAGVHDASDGAVVVVEIGDEDFDDDLRVRIADGFDGLGEMLGSAVAQVVAGDGGDDDVARASCRVVASATRSRFVGFERERAWRF